MRSLFRLQVIQNSKTNEWKLNLVSVVSELIKLFSGQVLPRNLSSEVNNEVVPKIILYSDAAGDGGCGITAIDPTSGKCSYLMFRLDNINSHGIAVLELAAAAAAIATFAYKKNVLYYLFLDNTVVESVLKRGSSSNEILNK
jgi:hypothetical protein